MMIMKIRTFLLACMAALPLAGQAQEDDMYFTSGKKNRKNTEERADRTQLPVRKQTMVVTYEDRTAPAAGRERDVDEYNRRYARRDNDTLYLDEPVYRQQEAEYVDEDGDYGCRLMRSRALLLGIPVNSRLYWDICYGPGSFYWDVYDVGFYTYAYPTGWYYGAYPWTWSYAYGSPWWPYGYHSWGWGGPYWGWNVSWYPGFHRPTGIWRGPGRWSSNYHGVRDGHRGAWYPSRGTASGNGTGRYSRPGATSRPGVSGGQTSPAARPSRSGIGRTYGGTTRPERQPSTGSQRPQRQTDVPSSRPTYTPQRSDRSYGGGSHNSGTVSSPSRSGGGSIGGGSRGGYGSGGRRR